MTHLFADSMLYIVAASLCCALVDRHICITNQLIPSSASALQIFDKALVETTFTAMYAQFCSELNKNLPEFEDPDSEDGKMLTFRRILLNKCQVSPA
jgi:hypothetical protein